MESFARLLSDHADIVRSAAELRVAPAGASDAPTARRAMIALSQKLRAHLVTEDRIVYRRLLACRDSGVAETARVARLSFAALAREWRAYVARWTTEAIGGDPAGFATDTETLLDRLAARITFENETLYPLAVGLADLPLRERTVAIVS